MKRDELVEVVGDAIAGRVNCETFDLGKGGLRDAITEAALKAIEQAGFAIVPKVATAFMVASAKENSAGKMSDDWEEMLKAAREEMTDE